MSRIVLNLELAHVQASDINALFGFRLECIERMGDQQGLWAWQRINALFNWLPLAALIEDRIICMHGGIGIALALPIQNCPPPFLLNLTEDSIFCDTKATL